MRYLDRRGPATRAAYVVLIAAVLSLLISIDPASADLATLTCSGAACPVTTCAYLDRPNTTYILQNDIRCPGTGMAIIADKVTLDLGGKTITYDDAAPVSVANSDFELGSGAQSVQGWDLSRAPAASWITGSFIRPVQVFSGSHSIRFTMPGAAQSVTSTGEVTLDPNTTYSISASVADNIGGGCGAADFSAAVTKFVELVGTSYRAELKGPTCRPMQMLTAKFRTPAGAPIRAKLRFGVDAGSSVAAHPVYFDDVRVQRDKPVGIAVGPQSWNPAIVPDLTRFGGGQGVTIRNGRIVQGRGASSRAYGITMEENRNNLRIENLTIDVYGPVGANIAGNGFTTGTVVRGNTLINRVRQVISRDNLEGYVVQLRGGGNEFTDNVIRGGIQGGLSVGGGGASLAKTIVARNRIYLNSRYTNGFAIGAGNSAVFENLVQCVGDGVCDDGSATCDESKDIVCSDPTDLSCRSCRGIYGGGGSEISRNTVRVQELERNQEYNGCQVNGAYGVQIEAAKDVYVHDNDILAVARRCGASAFRVNPNGSPGEAGNNIVTNNRFEARSLEPEVSAYALRIDGISDARATIRIDSNQLVSDSRWIAGVGLSGLELRANCFIDNSARPLAPLTSGNWNLSEQLAVRALTFTNPCFGNDAAKAKLSAAVISFEGGTTDKLSSFGVGWTLTVTVKDDRGTPLRGARIEIAGDPSAAVSATTDAAGMFETALTEFRNTGGVKEGTGRYRVVATSATGESSSAEITMDRKRDITMIVKRGKDEGASPVLLPPSNPSGNGPPVVSPPPSGAGTADPSRPSAPTGSGAMPDAVDPSTGAATPQADDPSVAVDEPEAKPAPKKSGRIINLATLFGDATLRVLDIDERGNIVGYRTVGGIERPVRIGVDSSGEFALRPVAIPSGAGIAESASARAVRIAKQGILLCVDPKRGRCELTYLIRSRKVVEYLGDRSLSFADLNDLPVNKGGRIVGTLTAESRRKPFVLENGVMTILPDRRGHVAKVRGEAIESGDDGVIRGTLKSKQRTVHVVWQKTEGGTWRAMVLPPDVEGPTRLHAGELTVSSTTGDTVTRAAVRIGNGALEPLDTYLPPGSGWKTLVSVGGVNALGMMVGTGITETGDEAAYLLILPERR